MFTAIVFAAPVISWIPPYGTEAAVDNLTADFDGYGPKDGISHLALQFWEPSGNGGVRYVSKDSYALEYMNDKEVGKIQDWADQYGIKTMLCLYNGVYDWDWPLAVSAFKTNQSKTVDALLAIVDDLNLGGVELDLEMTGTATDSDKDAYIEFAQILSDSLEVRGKDLTCASFSYEWNGPNWLWWNELEDHVTAITSMGYESIGSANSGWAGYSEQVAQMNDESKLMLGLPDNYDSWGAPSKSLVQHLTWIKNNGKAGVGLWDMELRSSAIKTKEVWQLLNEIRGDIITNHQTTVTVGIGGTVDPSGVVNIPEGDSKTFTITPDKWFVVDDVLVDGNSVGFEESYTLENVTGTHTIEVTFKTDPYAPDLHVYTMSTDANGTITPEGTSTVETGKRFSFSSEASNGYVIDYAKIDGVKRGPIISGSFQNSQSDHSVELFFKEASGGDLGKYTEWNSGISVTQWDTVFYNDTLWVFQDPGTWGLGMEPSVSLDAEFGGRFGTPPWKYAGLYNNTPSILVSADIDYRSAKNGSDTLIITTDTISAEVTTTTVDTVILQETAITELVQRGKSVAGIQLIQNGLAFIANENGTAQIELFDLRGRLIIDRSVSVQAGAVTTTGMSTQNVSRGVYLLVVSQGQQSVVQRIQK